MKEIKGDLFSQQCDAICVTTNGIVKKNGEAVMGGGVALAAAKKFPFLPNRLGYFLTNFGNRVHVLHDNGVAQDVGPSLNYFFSGMEEDLVIPVTPYAIVAFPTKHDWRNDSDIKLIETSCKQLVQITTERAWNRVCLTRPGCGLGGLEWSEVKPRIAKLLDSRFQVISPTNHEWLKIP